MKVLLRSTYAIAGVWCIVAVGSAIDPGFLPHAADLMQSVLATSFK